MSRIFSITSNPSEETYVGIKEKQKDNASFKVTLSSYLSAFIRCRRPPNQLFLGCLPVPPDENPVATCSRI